MARCVYVRQIFSRLGSDPWSVHRGFWILFFFEGGWLGCFHLLCTSLFWWQMYFGICNTFACFVNPEILIQKAISGLHIERFVSDSLQAHSFHPVDRIPAIGWYSPPIRSFISCQPSEFLEVPLVEQFERFFFLFEFYSCQFAISRILTGPTNDLQALALVAPRIN